MEITLKIYIKPFLSIEFACAVRQPTPYVYIFYESNVLFRMLHLELHFVFHIPPFTLLTALFPLHIPHFTLNSHFTLKISQSTLLTSHYFFHIPHSTLHTTLFTRHTVSHLSSSHLIPAHFFSSHHLFAYVMQAFMNHFPVYYY